MVISAAFDVLRCYQQFRIMALAASVKTWQLPLMRLLILQQFEAASADCLVTGGYFSSLTAGNKCVNEDLIGWKFFASFSMKVWNFHLNF